jgi:hypothetical protein
LCSPCCNGLCRAADMRTDADRDSSKVPPAPNSHPKFPKTCVRSVRSVRSVRNVRRGHAARGGQRFREVSQMPGCQNTLPKPAAALAALAAVRLTTLVGCGAGMAGKCGDVCGCMRLGESTRKRALAFDGSVVFPAFPRSHCHCFVIAGSRLALDLHLRSTAPISASRLRSFSCYTAILSLVCSA